jgi:uncharacterized phage-associated protein
MWMKRTRRRWLTVANVFDVAKYILQKTNAISTMKLQKLVYYAQAWSTVWDNPPDAPLFPERIEAWSLGPVVPELFAWHKGHFSVGVDVFPNGDVSRLSRDQRETIDSVLAFYGHRTAQWLSDLSHSEPPWRDARVGIPEGERGGVEITLESMAEYYGNLTEK